MYVSVPRDHWPDDTIGGTMNIKRNTYIHSLFWRRVMDTGNDITFHSEVKRVL